MKRIKTIQTNFFLHYARFSFIRALLLIMAFDVSIRITSQTFVDKHGQLSVEGGKIVDKDKKPVQLKGISLYWSQWIGKYYNYNTLRWLRDDWKCTVIRAAMAVENGGYLTNPDAEMAKVDSVVLAAIQLGIYVIIDWHDHHAQWHTNQAKDFFTIMAFKYGLYPNVIYETYNEPWGNISWIDSIRPYHIDIIDEIRQYDTANIIVCGSGNWSQDVDIASNNPIDRPDIAYSLHYYAATHKQWLRNKATTAMNNGIALFVTEYGTCESSGSGVLDYAESRTWWQFLDQHKISYCNWSLADKAETSAALQPGASINGGWDTTMLTASGKFVRSNLINDPFIETSGISNINMNGICLIYPNPARDNLNIILMGNADKNSKMEIFDITGKLIVTRKIQNSTLISDIGNFIPGIYQLKLINDNQVFRGSFIKE